MPVDQRAARIRDGFDPGGLPGTAADHDGGFAAGSFTAERDHPVRRGAVKGPDRSALSGQATIEFALIYGAVILPLTFMTIFVAEMLWVWHSVAEFTRDGARYATTHCWTSDGSNVLQYIETHVPPMIDQAQFQSGAAGI